MDKRLVFALVSGVVIFAAGCRDPNYKPDPLAEPCNIGGPMGKLEQAIASAPNPGAVPGRPVDCRKGPDGVMRLPPDKLKPNP
jgi:hypothetical protein